jgi:hypothetical protein
MNAFQLTTAGKGITIRAMLHHLKRHGQVEALKQAEHQLEDENTPRDWRTNIIVIPDAEFTRDDLDHVYWAINCAKPSKVREPLSWLPKWMTR